MPWVKWNWSDFLFFYFQNFFYWPDESAHTGAYVVCAVYYGQPQSPDVAFFKTGNTAF